MPSYSAQVGVSNTLFYGGYAALVPRDPEGAQWTFVDNIFDRVTWTKYCPEPWNCSDLNGPVGINHHNAYVGMATNLYGADRLWPRNQQLGSDPILASLTYATGPLGRFYLPTGSSLIDAGSQSSPNAHQFHFTSVTNNTKEASSQVDIGPHFVALVNGAPNDQDGDGTPDYAEDRNGNGVAEVSESDWQVPSTEAPKILGVANNSALPPGRAEVSIWVPSLQNAREIYLSIDDQSGSRTLAQTAPFALPLQFELDTRMLQSGFHTLRISALVPNPGSPNEFSEISGDAVSVNVANAVAFPAWPDPFEPVPNQLSLTTTQPSVQFSTYIFDHAYPRAYAHSPIRTINGAADHDGAISVEWDMLDDQGSSREDPLLDPSFFTMTELATSPRQVVANPASYQPADNYPATGMWGVAILDHISHNSSRYEITKAWYNSIARAAETSGGMLPPPGQLENGGTRNAGEPLYIRLQTLFPTLKPPDWHILFSSVFMDPAERVRNFYYFGHGEEKSIGAGEYGGSGGIESAAIAGQLRNLPGRSDNQRYRFVWLDGCKTAASDKWAHAFGLGAVVENKQLNTYKGRPGVFMGWDSSPFLLVGNVDTSTGVLVGYVKEGYENFRSRFLLRLNAYHYTFAEARNDSWHLMEQELQFRLKMYGYWGMCLNGDNSFNRQSDWP